jgi:iron complex transport system substrate-binding protein
MFAAMRMRRPTGLGVALLALSAILSCASPETHTPTPQRAQRVVTLAPNVTEILFWLGCGGRIIGTDDFSNFPTAAAGLAKVGGLHPSAERIARLRPDLVVGSSSADQSDIARSLSSIGVAFISLKTDRLSDIGPAAALLERRIDCPSSGNAVQSFHRALEGQRRIRASRPRVLVLVWPNPLYVAGRDTFADDLLQLVGAENAVSRTTVGWPAYSMESIVASPPDVLLFPSKQMDAAKLQKLLEGDVAWRNLEVVKSKRYYVLDEDRFTRPGPRMVDAAAELNALLDSIGMR